MNRKIFNVSIYRRLSDDQLFILEIIDYMGDTAMLEGKDTSFAIPLSELHKNYIRVLP